MRRGKGKYAWANGSSYSGYVKDGVRAGEGILRDGEVTYTGQWLDGKKDGEGASSPNSATDERTSEQ